MTGPVPTRLSLQTKWENDIPLKFLWTIGFLARGSGAASVGTANNIESIAKNVSTILTRYEGSGKWPVNPKVYTNQSDSNNTYGYMFAASVGFPSDGFNITNSSLGGAGGFLPNYIGGERNGYGGSNNLSISFIETNVDIIDNLIRPWIIAASYKGLIEDNKEDIKCDIMINLYTRDKNQNTQPIRSSADTLKTTFERRKSFIFKDAIPFQVSGDEISYGDLSVSDVTKTVSFAFSNYYTIPIT